MKIITIISLFVLMCYLGLAQQINEWKDHLSYYQTTKVFSSPEMIFCVTPYSLFSYEKENGFIQRVSKINYLSDIEISDASYSPDFQSLIVGYTNGNIDIINGNKTTNYRDILRATQITNKTINQVKIVDTIAYISGGFGIVLFDLSKKEIIENYSVGTSDNPIEVNATQIKGDTIFSATNKGLYYSLMNNPLIKFPQAWNKISTLQKPNIEYTKLFLFNEKLYLNYSTTDFLGDTLYQVSAKGFKKITELIGNNNMSFYPKGDTLVVSHNFNVTVYNKNFEVLSSYFDYQSASSPQPRYAIFDESAMWIADFRQGLIKANDPFNNEIVIPSSPPYSGNRDIISTNNTVYVTRGDRAENWGKTFTEATLMVYENNEWSSIDKTNNPPLDSIQDIINLASNPNNPTEIIGATIGFGLVKFEGNKVKSIYNDKNSTLENIIGYGVGVSDMKFDNNGNLWCTNMLTNSILHVKDAENNWESFSFPTLLNEETTADLLINGFNQKWVSIRDVGILVFDDNYTPFDKTDDQVKLLTPSEGNGNLPSATILSIAEDKDGEIWIGSDKGLRVIYNPEEVFNNNAEAQDILIKQGLYFQVLLESEAITSIAIDGGDNKWIGTQGSGVFCLSPDGTNEIFHFTAENSALWSNNIQSIGINQKTGEVYIGTDKGLISYRGLETEPNSDYSQIYAYPNPVKSTFTGPVAVTGLVRNSEVRITDLAGNIVLKTIAPGGQILWDKKDTNGNMVASGVYLVFVSTLDGIQREVTKIFIAN